MVFSHRNYVMQQHKEHSYDTIVYIGRFQPCHNAHLATIIRACSMAKQVVIVIGSANQPRDEDNPFTQQEREIMILRAVQDAAGDSVATKLKFVSVENQIYSNPGWALDVVEKVEPQLNGPKVGIIGHNKDESSFYLALFPQWAPIDQPMMEILDATTIRQMYFSEKHNINFFKAVVPPAVIAFLEEFEKSPEYQYVVDEATYIRNYRAPHKLLPYPPSFNTGDCIVFKDGHVLMIRRKASPGKGLLAFPGGFLNAESRTLSSGEFVKADANVLDCAIRELYEETKIKLPEGLIRGCIKEEKIFSAAKRSRRGRIITTAQIIVLPSDGKGFPKVRGSDDAMPGDEKTMWLPIHKVNRVECFEDHKDMLNYGVSQLKKYQ